MDPQAVFCPNLDCPARGRTGQGNIHVHSIKERRYRDVYNFCTYQKSLRVALYVGRAGHRHWVLAHPGDGNWHHRSSLDGARVAWLSYPTLALDAAHTTRKTVSSHERINQHMGLISTVVWNANGFPAPEQSPRPRTIRYANHLYGTCPG